ncbi:MAG: hypothetical protein A2V72_01900 [Candidatus Nealsonbacteria bacterium RBG_13_37_56]|uniref:Undecaprenyl-phosphate alpha-N-acetylglucosaminyl 1-phosphate transferase n=1 Tax=Candidatus Nealsonbacteria bacterium RBG_13_37_56 TaxID=1801661 RepID=A0A1G2DVX8_9BACT|nr:MAG: hypothetical protein A2V72_01900 [Candidatus Nealsonbacteria bacterium RBG_13_37_56]
MIYYLSIISFFISLALTFIFYKIGERYKIYDLATEDPLKIHKKSVSCLGGLAMILAMGIVFSLKMILENNFNWQILGIIIGAVLIFLIGFTDDLKWRDKFRIKRIYKFIFLVLFSGLSALIIFKVGIGIGLILTFGFIFILINAINYQDGMDGAAGAIVIISLIAFGFLAWNFSNNLALLISLVSGSITLGFLFFNFPPAKIFMGDSGAYFLGFILAVLGLIFLKPYSVLTILGLIFILGLPLLDGVFTNLRRAVKGRSIFIGDRAHFFDRLLQRGFSVRKTLLICCITHIIFVILGLSIYIYGNTII